MTTHECTADKGYNPSKYRYTVRIQKRFPTLQIGINRMITTPRGTCKNSRYRYYDDSQILKFSSEACIRRLLWGYFHKARYDGHLSLSKHLHCAANALTNLSVRRIFRVLV
jgi:hypothetical protein